MMSSKNNVQCSLLALVAMLALLALAAEASSSVENFKDAEEPAAIRHGPSNLLRMLLSGQKFSSLNQPSMGLGSYKRSALRSSSGMDALAGVTLGKRTIPLEYLNLEPFFARQFGMHSRPRMYDMRWGPLDLYESNDSN